MYFAGEDFLTNSAFAGEEHVRLTRRYSGDELLHFAHPAADRDRRKLLFGTPKLLPKLLLLLAQMRSFARQRALLDRPFTKAEQFLHGIRLGEKVKGTELDRLDRIGQRVVCREEHHRDGRMLSFQLPQNVD